MYISEIPLQKERIRVLTCTGRGVLTDLEPLWLTTFLCFSISFIYAPAVLRFSTKLKVTDNHAPILPIVYNDWYSVMEDPNDDKFATNVLCFDCDSPLMFFIISDQRMKAPQCVD